MPEVDYEYAFNARLTERGRCAICNDLGANIDIDIVAFGTPAKEPDV